MQWVPHKRLFSWGPMLFVTLALLVSFLAGRQAAPVWMEKATGDAAFRSASEVAATTERLKQAILGGGNQPISEEVVVATAEDRAPPVVFVTVGRHFGFWALLPAIVTLAFCVLFREPLPALLLGITCGALLLGRVDLTESILLPGMASAQSANILLLYLWLLGTLLGVWSRTGAAMAFAQWTCQHFVRGPRSAKLVAWGLGVIFFQGGTISTVLVGTTVRPITDRYRISKEELAYIVDSTASPIAALIAFNAWPIYVQALILVPGVSYLATEEDRIAFFFSCTPLSFYSVFAVLGTFLLAIDRAPFLGRRFRAAIATSRAKYYDDLAAAGNTDPLTVSDLDEAREAPVQAAAADPKEGEDAFGLSDADPDYSPSAYEFIAALAVLIVTVIGTAALGMGPQVKWAFAAAVVVSVVSALVRGMTIQSLVRGIGNGLRSVTVASVILILAVVLGGLTTELGGGLFLSMAIGDQVPRLLFPGLLFLLTAAMAFGTGTSWGTYAIAFPLTMPLAVEMASVLPEGAALWFVMVCFAAVLNGSVFGDQCSPISDTTILSSLVSGCELMQHVRTQLVPALLAGALAVACWTMAVLVLT